MESYLETLHNGIWDIVNSDYKPPLNGPQTKNEVARIVLFSCLSDAIFWKAKGFKEAKDIWNILYQACEGDPKTKKTRLMNLKYKYDHLRMVENEGVLENYIHRVIDLVDAIRVASGYLKEGDVIRKIMLALPRSYKPKKCAI